MVCIHVSLVCCLRCVKLSCFNKVWQLKFQTGWLCLLALLVSIVMVSLLLPYPSTPIPLSSATLDVPFLSLWLLSLPYTQFCIHDLLSSIWPGPALISRSLVRCPWWWCVVFPLSHCPFFSYLERVSHYCMLPSSFGHSFSVLGCNMLRYT